MTMPLTFFDLFGEVTVDMVATMWPPRVQPFTGFIGNWPPPQPAFNQWLAALNNAFTLTDVRTGAADDRVAIEAKVTSTTVALYPGGFPFVLSSMPDVEFRVQYATPQENQIHFFASQSDRGVELVVERLPVQILLPAGLIGPHPDQPGTVDLGEFRPGHLDDLMIRFDGDQPVSIFVHARLHMTEDGEFDVRTAVPISFGRCTFSGIPCLAVHDFQLVPSPSIAPRNVHWLRHAVTPWAPEVVGPIDGCFSVRSVHIDPDTEPIAAVARWLNSHETPADGAVTVTGPPAITGKGDAHAEFVLDDLVVPFYSPWVLPIPRHVTVGVRRRVLDRNDPEQAFSFDNAPVRVSFSRSPAIGLMVEDFFFRSSGAEAGLTFDASVVFGESGHSDAAALGITLEEQYTFSITYKREFTAAGKPAPGTGPLATFNQVLHFEIATVAVDVMAFKLGFSLGRFLIEDRSFGDSAVATIDLFVSMPPTDQGVIKLRALDGEEVAFVLEGLGWRLGSLHFEGVTMPDGVVLIIADRFGLAIEQIGLRAENSATYFSISAGLMIQLPSGFSGGVFVKNFRFRISGNPGAPPIKLDGFFLKMETSTFGIEAGGYYAETTTGIPPAQVTVKEFGLTGTVAFSAGGADYLFGLDVIIGQLQSAAANFEYFLFQAFYHAAFQCVYVEFSGARLLFVRNMQPKLDAVDKDSRELRYYTWYKNNDPLIVPGERRLAAWQPANDALAVGLGASMSLAGCGAVFEINGFILFVYGPAEKGLLFVNEIRLLHSPEPIGYLAIELDFQNGRYSGVLGVQLKLSTFVDEAPAWLDSIGRLTGTLFAGNKPGTFAIGRLADQRTWLTLAFDWEIWLVSHFGFGLCVEYVDGGPRGFGFFIRAEGGIDGGIVQIKYYAGLGLAATFMDTASNDYAFVAYIEAGLRIVLFGFLNFGVNATATYRNVGTRPSRGELSLQIRLETPWFLPDVTWTLDSASGTLAPSDLATSTSPLESAEGIEGTTRHSSALHVERFATAHPPQRASRTYSVNELKAGPASEAARLANFAADSAARPISIDSTLVVAFAVAVNDQLALSTDVAPHLGDKQSGDLRLTYDLVGLAVRRRARFGVDRAWHTLDTVVALPPDFSDPNGVQLTGTLAAQTVNAWWDLDQRIAGRPATKRLFLNSETPFQFATANPEADEELLRDNPSWPCCPGRKDPIRLHRVDWHTTAPGQPLTGSTTFSDSASQWAFVASAHTVLDPFGAAGAPAGSVALVLPSALGVVARAAFDEDVAYCAVRLLWPARAGTLAIVAFDAAGAVVGTATAGNQTGNAYQSVVIGGTGPIRRLELRAAYETGGVATHGDVGDAQIRRAFAVDSAVYVALADYLGVLRAAKRCAVGVGGYSGRGKLFFLPNHEYEFTITTRVAVSHPTTTPDAVDVPEYLYFRTKGLPGLNAVDRVGEEIEAYVRSAYAGGRGLLYRAEPVVLCFAEDFFVAVPLASRPAATADEHTTLLRMQLVVQPDIAAKASTPGTATSDDWIVTHRHVVVPPRVGDWAISKSGGVTMASPMTSINPRRQRLARLTQRDGSVCPAPDPLDVVATVLIAQPQGETDPGDPARELWTAGTPHTAAVRVEGAPFVQRDVFEDADLTAFDLVAHAGGAGTWAVDDGRITVDAGAGPDFAIFGDGDWNHLTVTVSVTTSDTAGVAIALPAAGAPAQGLVALIENAAAGRRLVLLARTAGVGTAELAQAPLPPADRATPVAIVVAAFDDRIRATVGDVSIEAPRGERREGRVALVAAGQATFTGLTVAGLELYAFPFTTSRWRSFAEHVHSWTGSVDTLAPDAFGPGTTTATVTSLWAESRAAVTAAMSPAAGAADRDAVFGRWLRELGLPLKDEVPGLEVSAFRTGGLTGCLLLESPEPIDFAGEITAVLERSGLVHTGSARPGAAPPLPVLDLNAELTGSTLLGSGPVATARILDVARHLGGLDVEIAIEGARSISAANVVLVERIDEQRYRVFTGPLQRTDRGVRVRARESDQVTVLRPHESVVAAGLADHLQPDEVAATISGVPELGGVVVAHAGWRQYTEVPLRVIQDGSARHALLVPMGEDGTPARLVPGAYRLTLSIERTRWPTTAPADDLNRYRDSASVAFTL